MNEEKPHNLLLDSVEDTQLKRTNTSVDQQRQRRNSSAITITTVLRIIFITIVFLAILSFIALIIWGIYISPAVDENPSEIVGLPTIYDMLYRSMPITAFYVVIISLWGETRVIWAVMQLIEPNREELHWPHEIRTGECCFVRFPKWFECVTFTLAVLGALQVLFLMLLAVVSVVVNPAHKIIAGLMAIITVIRAILLIIRRGAVHQQYVKGEQRSFGKSQWYVIRIFYMSNLVVLIVSGIVFGVISNFFKAVPNIAVAQYMMFFCSIIDVGFQIFDSPATHDVMEKERCFCCAWI
jgi:magnesium-transporting ATPase (P-type)